jgi:hypothetical protein
MARPKKIDTGVVPELETPVVETSEETKAVEMTTIKSISVEFKKHEPYRNPNDVTIRIEYPKGYSGAKYHKDGDVTIVSKESAELFVKKGIAKIIN